MAGDTPLGKGGWGVCVLEDCCTGVFCAVSVFAKAMAAPVMASEKLSFLMTFFKPPHSKGISGSSSRLFIDC